MVYKMIVLDLDDILLCDDYIIFLCIKEVLMKV